MKLKWNHTKRCGFFYKEKSPNILSISISSLTKYPIYSCSFTKSTINLMSEGSKSIFNGVNNSSNYLNYSISKLSVFKSQ